MLCSLPLAIASSATPEADRGDAPPAAPAGPRPGRTAPGRWPARRRRPPRRCRPAARPPGRSPCGQPGHHRDDDAQRGDRRDDAHRPGGQRRVEADQADHPGEPGQHRPRQVAGGRRRARRRAAATTAIASSPAACEARRPPARRRQPAGDGAAEEVGAAPRAGWRAGRGGRPSAAGYGADAPTATARGSHLPVAGPGPTYAARMVARREADEVPGGVLPGTRRAARRHPPARGRARGDPGAAAAGAARRGADRRRALPARPRGELGTGRLVLLHDPAGHEAWQGTFRVVTYVRAELEPEMAADPLLPGRRLGLADRGAGRPRRRVHGGQRHRDPGGVGELRRDRRRAGVGPDRDPGVLDPARRRASTPTCSPGATCCAPPPGCRRWPPAWSRCRPGGAPTGAERPHGSIPRLRSADGPMTLRTALYLRT